MKVTIEKDEWYPVYDEASPSRYTKEVEVSEDLWKRYLELKAQFSDVLADVYMAVNGND